MRTFRKYETIHAILYIAQNMGERKDIHKICKVLYFADQAHLSRYGRSITGDRYIAMNYGPVPSNVEDMFKAVRGISYFSDCAEDLKAYFSFKNKYFLVPLQAADLDYLSESDVECLNAALEKCEGKSFEELTSMSHDLAWQNTMRDREISMKDILREAGDSDEYIEYIAYKQEMEKTFA